MRSWFVHLCVVTVLLQAGYAAVRVMISYKALELGGNGTTVGILTALYSLLPLVAAMPIGRVVDNFHAAAVLRSGAVLALVAITAILFSPNLIALSLGSIALGFSHILTMVSSQGYIPLLSTPDQYDRRFGGLTVWISVGQAIGIPAVGLLASRDPEGHVNTTLALAVMSALAVSASLISLSPRLITPATRKTKTAPDRQSTISMLTTPGMRPAVFSSLIVLTSMDLATAYLPVLGEHHGFSVLTVTIILTARAIAAIISRLFLTQLLHLAPRNWLLVSGSLCSALPIAVIPALTHPLAVGALLSVAGFFWGLAQPLTMTWVAGLVSSTNRASALSLRLTGNRLGQVVIPLTAGAIAGPTGADGVFVLTGGLLAGAAASTWRALNRSRPEDTNDRTER